jgi:hypothetical protein
MVCPTKRESLFVLVYVVNPHHRLPGLQTKNSRMLFTERSGAKFAFQIRYRQFSRSRKMIEFVGATVGSIRVHVAAIRKALVTANLATATLQTSRDGATRSSAPLSPSVAGRTAGTPSCGTNAGYPCDRS